MGIILRSLVCLCCLIIIPCYSQEYTDPATFSIRIQEESSLDQVLKELHDNFGVDFAYPSQFIGEYKVDKGYFSAPDLPQFLDQLFSNREITYKIIDGRQVLLRMKNEPYQRPVIPVSGRVIDRSSRQPLPDAAVLLDTLMLGAYTDAAGEYYLDIPAELSSRKLLIRMLGYQTEYASISGISEFHEVTLMPVPVEFPEIIVAYKLPLINLTGAQLSMSMNKNKFDLLGGSGLAGSDLFRKIQLLPGIAAHDDLSTKIRIRGSDASETLILLDGIPIYRADHFYGIFSSIDEQYIQQVDIYKNALPVQYGGRTGGMVSMQSVPDADGFHGSLDLNMLTTSLQLKGSLSDEIQFVVNGRTTYDNAAQSKFFDWIKGNSDFYLNETQTFPNRNPLIQTSPSLRFYDINSKLMFQPGPRQKMDLNFYRSRDDLVNEYENQFTNRQGGRQITLEEYFSNLENWENTGLSLNYGLQIDETWDLKSTLHYSEFSSHGNLTSMLVEGDPVVTRVSGFTNQQFNGIRDWGALITLSKIVSDSGKVHFGFGMNKYSNEYGLSVDQDDILAGDNSAWEPHVFGNYDFGQPGRWNLSLGARTSYYSETGDVYFSPGINSKIHLSSRVLLKASYARPFQFIREVSHEDRLGRSVDVLIMSDDNKFQVSGAHNIMAGFKYETDTWCIDVEFYKKNISNVLEHALLFPGFQENEVVPSLSREYLILTGSGRTIGLDLLVGYNKGLYSGWMAYTLSKSTNRFRAIQRNESFPSQDDRRHQLKWVNTIELGRLDLSLNYIYVSGKPYTNISRLDQLIDRRHLRVADRINLLPSYHRMDFSISYPFKIGRFNASTSLSVFNLTDNQNVKFLQYIFSIPTDRQGQNLPRNLVIGNETGLIDRTFNLDFKIEF